MKTIITALIIVLPFLQQDKSIKVILKDGQFAKLPAAAKVIGHEVVNDAKKRFGYLAFQGNPEEIKNWIENSHFLQTTTKDVFESNIIVWPTKRPAWFKEFSNKVQGDIIFYSKRDAVGFTALAYLDTGEKFIYVEYEIKI